MSRVSALKCCLESCLWAAVLEHQYRRSLVFAARNGCLGRVFCARHDKTVATSLGLFV